MFKIVKSVITAGAYDLTKMLEKIDIIWIKGSLTDEERAELIQLAREKAMANNSYAPYDEQISDLASKIEALTARVAVLEEAMNNESGEGETPDEGEDSNEEPANEYPEYVQPLGYYDAYNAGDKVTYKGVKYVCIINGCVWAPDVYPAAWEEVKTDTEPEESGETTETEV